jgi:hypothetical protein
MSDVLHFVFSTPPASITDAEFDAFYERHVAEILETAGFLAARRYWLAPIVGDRPPTGYRHLSLYEVEGDSRDALALLEQRADRGELTTPDWFPKVRFASFDGIPLEEAAPRLPAHAYLVFSKPPSSIPFGEYSRWYATHARENLTADGFDAAWRYGLQAVTIDGDAPCAASHAALYEVSAELPELRRALAEARDAGRVHFPDWFGEIEFASVDCVAASSRISSPTLR